MRLEWNEAKCKANAQKHGIDFADVGPAFQGPMLVVVDDREDYGETRFIGIGQVGNVVIALVFTESETKKGEPVVRLISARKANAKERHRYHEEA